MKKLLTLLLFSNLLFSLLQAQPVHQIKGTVIEKNSRQPLEFINVMILGLNKGGVTNAEGHFTIEQVPPGIYRLQATAIGYKSVTTPEYILSTKDLNISIEMEENLTELAGVTVTASPFRRDLESPVSLRIIGLQEIEKSPGANRDISRIVQSYPGVAFSPIGYRNDLIVRGGSPSENRFYLDGVEIPNINHFSTQGASGGPVGILNADLIREVNFYTGAFPTDRGNALSSVLDFKLRDGDMEHNSLKATLGASEVSLTSNGHIGKKTSYLVSVRQSYLQFLFDMLDLPFLPTFTDAQFKLKTRFNVGTVLERTWGPKRFLFYYIACGIGAGLIQEGVQYIKYIVDYSHYSQVDIGTGIIPMGEFLNMLTTVGASGAVYAILLAFGMLFPNNQLFIFPLPSINSADSHLA